MRGFVVVVDVVVVVVVEYYLFRHFSNFTLPLNNRTTGDIAHFSQQSSLYFIRPTLVQVKLRFSVSIKPEQFIFSF